MSAKLSPVVIFQAHLATLRNDVTGRISIIDWLTFYGVPFVAGFITFLLGQRVTNEVFNGSASIFGIFVGLLLNVQVAIFSIFQRRPERSPDPAAQAVFDKQFKRRATVLRALNANVAYLILICSFAIAACITFLGLAQNSALFTGILILMYLHVILSLLMVVKRAFVLFDAEYLNI